MEESLLESDPPLIIEAWIRMWVWYKDTVDRPPPPSRGAINRMMEERVELYRNVPSPLHPIPMDGTTFYIE